MASGLNKVMLIGYLGADPELRFTASGTAVCNFTLAVSDGRGSDSNGNSTTEWLSVTVWDKLADACAQYLSKGSRAYVEGRLQTRSWQDKDGQKRSQTEVVAHSVLFLSRPKASAAVGEAEATLPFA